VIPNVTGYLGKQKRQAVKGVWKHEDKTPTNCRGLRHTRGLTLSSCIRGMPDTTSSYEATNNSIIHLDLALKQMYVPPPDTA
jgi:hypothetical protein